MLIGLLISPLLVLVYMMLMSELQYDKVEIYRICLLVQCPVGIFAHSDTLACLFSYLPHSLGAGKAQEASVAMVQ